MKATNRQKKLLTFFETPFHASISTGAAGWEIASIMEDSDSRERWQKYLYLTKDLGSESPAPLPYDEKELQAVEIPDDWRASDEIRKLKVEIVSLEMSKGAPFDVPAPKIKFAGSSFIFTGKFDYGSRKACQSAVIERGGDAPSRKFATRATGYLVVGNGGSNQWSRGSYGNKIESAIIARREAGTPAIISEDHWVKEMEAN